MITQAPIDKLHQAEIQDSAFMNSADGQQAQRMIARGAAAGNAGPARKYLESLLVNNRNRMRAYPQSSNRSFSGGGGRNGGGGRADRGAGMTGDGTVGYDAAGMPFGETGGIIPGGAPIPPSDQAVKQRPASEDVRNQVDLGVYTPHTLTDMAHARYAATLPEEYRNEFYRLSPADRQKMMSISDPSQRAMMLQRTANMRAAGQPLFPELSQEGTSGGIATRTASTMGAGTLPDLASLLSQSSMRPNAGLQGAASLLAGQTATGTLRTAPELRIVRKLNIGQTFDPPAAEINTPPDEREFASDYVP